MPDRPAIEASVSVRLPLEALPGLLSPEQIEALLGGIAGVLTANAPPDQSPPAAPESDHA